MSLSRRELLHSAFAAGAAASVGAVGQESTLLAADRVAINGRIKHSVVFWCFNVGGDKWDIEKTCQIAKGLGCESVEICGPEHFPTIKKHGLTCAIAANGMPGASFMKGFNNLRYHDEVIATTSKMIEDCAAANIPSVIAFTGYKWNDADDPKSGEISLEQGAANCVKGLKKIAALAEKKGVTICLEHLNSRDGSHPMKGHPGYQGDDIDYVCDIVRNVGSPRVKVLFDVYHVQIMNGDIIRRIEECKDVIGHIHTAGNPGRAELDDNQEINYPPIMRKLVEIGYQGYVGHEFIPTRDPIAGLREAIKLCDV